MGDWARAFEVLVPFDGIGDCDAARLCLALPERGTRLFSGGEGSARRAGRECLLHASKKAETTSG